ncbi:hypothetical protein MTR67_031242 [Solanum verrucosum]|uniref:Integrase core domain containing protein n=1 Tax=Solanum verrucosum TaxID=315347 RepID=A0AAF0U256_SOLVR|nr:hypothetical protein MTR67_031242 [Solanum verrucosum]
MEWMMDTKIQGVHKCLDAFELRVLESLAPTIDVTTFQTELARLRSDVDALLDPAKTVLETTHVDEADDVVMTTLFGDTMPPPDPSHVAGKHHRSSDHTFDTEEARRAKKRGDISWRQLKGSLLSMRN